MRRLALLLLTCACNDPGATLEITDIRTGRLPDRRVLVDIDVLAHEFLGDNIGTYCTRMTFTGEPNFVEHCSADLEDGDTKTIRFISERDLPPGALLTVRIRLGKQETRRDLAAPGYH